MKEALRQAIESMYSNGIPFGAALYDKNHKLVHSAHNLVKQRKDKKLHAEYVLFTELENSDNEIDFSECTLVTTCEPCSHCFYVAYNKGVRKYVYGTTITDAVRVFGSDECVPITELADDIYTHQTMYTECLTLFEMYGKKGLFYKNVFDSVGTITEQFWMNVALNLAHKGMIEANEIPVAVIIVKEEDINKESILSQSYTMTYTANSPIVHGDFQALMLAQREVYDCGYPITMYSTLEPHLLGFGAALKSRVRKVCYGLSAPTDGGSCFFENSTSSKEMVPFIVGGVLREKQYLLFKEFLELNKDNHTRVGYTYVKDLVDYYEGVYL